MTERVSVGAGGQRLGASGGDIRRAGFAKVTADQVLEHASNVAGYFDGYLHRIATVKKRASLRRATALARGVFPDGSGL